MLDLPEFIIAVFTWVDDLLKKSGRLRERGPHPQLSDSEVLTMEIVGEFLGCRTDKELWEYFRRHWIDWFPRLPGRTSFTRQAANLWMMKLQLLEKLSRGLGAQDERIHIVDAFPVKVCGFKRSGRSRVFRGQAAYGYCAAKKEIYYGFQGHLVVTTQGVITSMSLTAANVSETQGIWDVSGGMGGTLIGDKGYLSKALREQMSLQGINLQTPLRSNMKDDRDPAFVRRLLRIRKTVETVISQLAGRFGIERTWARDPWHLTSRMARKLLAHTMGVWLNVCCGRKPLRMEGLLAA
jgi:hypothetical protein